MSNYNEFVKKASIPHINLTSETKSESSSDETFSGVKLTIDPLIWAGIYAEKKQFDAFYKKHQI